MIDVGSRIKEYRIRAGLSRKAMASKLAEVLGSQTDPYLMANYLYTVEARRRRASIEYLEACAKVLGVELVDLLREDGDQEVPASDFYGSLPADLKEFIDHYRTKGEVGPLVLLSKEVNRQQLTPEQEEMLHTMLRALAVELAKQIKGASPEGPAQKP